MRRAPIAATGVALLLSIQAGLAFGAGNTAAQAPAALPVEQGRLVEVVAGRTLERHDPILAPERLTASAPTADIQVDYNGFSSEAEATFEAAVEVWEARIVSSQVIHVDATWRPMHPNILGGAGATFNVLHPDNRWYPIALSESLCGCNRNPSWQPADITADFNSSFPNWYLGADGAAPSGKWDFFTVVLHEIGHGLGFYSSFSVAPSGKGSWGISDGSTRSPMRFDTFEWSAATGGNLLTNKSVYANPSNALKTQITDGSVYFGGPEVVAELGARARLYAPNPWQQGSSNSHFDEFAFPTGTQHALMTPSLANGEVIHDPGPLTMALFRDIGWETSGGGGADVSPPIVHPPAASFVQPQTVGSKVGVEVTWPAADDESGIGSYDLQRKKGSGAWISVTLTSSTATSAVMNLAPGSNYRFRLSATDTAGNTSAYVMSATAKLARAQETAGSASYAGSWKRVSVGGASGGYVRRSITPGNTASYAFNGSAVGLISTLGPDRGVAELRLDGVLLDSVDLYAPTLTPAQLVWSSNVASASHVFEVRVTNNGNPSSTGTRVDIDAFVAWK